MRRYIFYIYLISITLLSISGCSIVKTVIITNTVTLTNTNITEQTNETNPTAQTSISLVIPRTEWQDITSIYTNETRPINVKVGERFLIRYDMNENDMFPTFDAVYDTKVIESMGTVGTSLEQAPYYTGWFCFQALKTGNTQITVLHESWHLATNRAEPNLLEQKIFQVIITG